ncbi:MAG TPA: type II toxin-antitoxin system VapB family antitoxin [Devosiaceae bacterium]|jgi:Arc/MetJ family transcription regulator|nr:type II toxin-antitoxin system VapB family antitoxin [Devosiaceae bacterium]
MRTTVALDDDLVEKAQEFTGIKEKSALLRVALEALLQREAARRLIALGGSAPDLVAPPRHRTIPARRDAMPPKRKVDSVDPG